MVSELEILGQCGLFRSMTVPETEALLPCLRARRRELRRGELLWHSGDRVSECAVLLRGRLRAESVTESGTRQLMALHAPGALVGDVLMASRLESPVDVLAAEESELLLFPAEAILSGCEKNCAAHLRLRENLLAEIAEKYFAQRRRILWLSEPRLRGRIAARLLDEAQRQGADSFSLGCTREELAAVLGVNRSALSRELSRMRQEGLLDFRRDRFRLIDREKIAGYIGNSI